MLFTDVQLRAKCHATLIKFSTIEKFTSEGQKRLNKLERESDSMLKKIAD